MHIAMCFIHIIIYIIVCIVNTDIEKTPTVVYISFKGWCIEMIKVHLSKLLGERKMKISDLANATGLHRNGLSKLYNENTDGIKFETLEKICKALDCEIADLLEIIED